MRKVTIVPITEYHDIAKLEEKIKVAADNGDLLQFSDGSCAMVTRVDRVMPDKKDDTHE